MDQLGFFSTEGALALALDTTTPPERTVVDRILECADALRDLDHVDHRALKDLGERFDLSIQDRYNAIEAMLVQAIASGTALDQIHERMVAMPAQSIRSIEKEAHQQFSTPPKHAAALAAFAQLTADDIVLEPSAGTGMIAAFAVRAAVAGLYLNELDTTRLGIAKRLLRPRFATDHDATFLHALFKGQSPTVVMMNPPFSTDADGHNRGASVGLRHLVAAIHIAANRGRIVAIVGSNQHPDICDAWKSLIGPLPVQLRAAITIDGSDYYRMGTTFDNVIIVLDKTTTALECVESSLSPRPIDDLLATIPQIARLEAEQSVRRTFAVEGPAITKSRARVWTPGWEDVAPVRYAYSVPERAENSGPFAAFVAHVRTEGARDHASELVESVALSMVKPPQPTVDVLLPADRVSAFSHEQIETIILANQAFTRTVEPDDAPVTGGFMVGHGTGFGKGRTVAGIVLTQMLQGHTKAAWFSKTRDLFEDASRDWCDAAGEAHEDALFDLTATSANTDISHQHGILFSTYATLRSDAREGTRSRLDQITAWLGADFAGVIVFDESHELANAISTDGERGRTDASAQGLAALELQKRLPKAKIVYTSATAASKIEAFAYACRLGLWGRGTAFTQRSDFISAMVAGGTGAMELLCRDAKALGLYTSASLTLDGVTCERLEHHLSDDEIAGYNEVAKAWSIIRASVDRQLGDKPGNYSAIARSQLASTCMRTMQALLTSLAMNTVLPDIDRSLDEGFSPVIQLANTYEADQERALAKLANPEDLESIDLSPKETIKRYLAENYPTALLQPISDDEGNIVKWTPVLDENQQAVADPEAVAERDQLLDNLDAIIAPDSPLSQLCNTYGDRLGECTGRSRRVVRKMVDGILTTVVEKRGSNASSADTDAFMSGDKDLLVFSEKAGGVGRSYHADRAAKNQRPRKHYGLQLGWRAEEALQGFGRTNRNNQVHRPHWVLVTTDAPGQRRFISSIARKIEQLGACTRGQRDASGTSFLTAEDNLESEYATSAVNAILEDIANHDTPVAYSEWLQYTGLTIFKENSRKPLTMTVTRFLNQILCCPLDRDPEQSAQHRLMNALIERTQQNIDAAKAKGTFDAGVQMLNALAITKTSERIIHTDPTGATTLLVDLDVTRESTRHTTSTALSCYRRSKALYNFGAFVKTDDGIRLVYKVANVTTNGRNEDHYRVIGPSRTTDYIGAVPGDIYSPEIHDHDEVRDLWNAELDQCTDTYVEKMHLVCGTLLPIYDALPKNRAKIYAVILPDGTRLIGRVLSTDEASTLLARFNLGCAASLEDALRHVEQGGTVLLSRGYYFKRVLHEGRRRIELTADGTGIRAAAQRAADAGLEVVRKGFQIRCFLPEQQAREALERFDNSLSVVNLAA